MEYKISKAKDVEKISALFKGAQNDFFGQNNNCMSQKMNKKLLRKVPINFHNQGNNNVTTIYYALSSFMNPCESLGEIFFEDETNIKTIGLSVGGTTLDKINDCDVNIFNALRNLFSMKGIPISILKKGIPHTEWHDIRVHVEFYNAIAPTAINASVQIYQNKNDTGNIAGMGMGAGAGADLSSFCSYHVAKQTDNGVSNRMRLNFNHVTTALMIKTNTGEKPTHISFNGGIVLLLDRYVTKFGYDVYKFKPNKLSPAFTTQSSIDSTLKCSINLSRVDNCVVHFANNTPKTVQICQIYLNCTRFMAGMGGSMYAN